MKRTGIILCAAAVSLMTGCNEPEFVKLVKLGSLQSEICLTDLNPGDSVFTIASNVDYDARVTKGGEWLSITSVTEDAVKFHYTGNTGFRRSARIVISAEGRVDSMTVYQEGLYMETVQLDTRSVSVPCTGGTYRVGLLTNMLRRDLCIEAGDPAVFSDVTLRDNTLSFTVLPTVKRDRRRYGITVYCLDGWGSRVASTLEVVQEAKPL